MKLKANDALHITAVQSDPIRPGDTFEIDGAAGRSLVDRRLATEMKPKAEPAAAPATKAIPAKAKARK